MKSPFNEDIVEASALDYFEALGYASLRGGEIAPGGPQAERDSYNEVLLRGRLEEAVRRLNPKLPPDLQAEAIRRVTTTHHTGLIANNRAFHRLLIEGVRLERRRDDGSIGTELVRLVDFDLPESNDCLVVNQYTVIENQHNRRPDIVLFVNGIPLAVIELKNAADEEATTYDAFKDLQVYKREIPSLFVSNAVVVASDGTDARLGTLTSNWERFLAWRTIDGDRVATNAEVQLEVLIRGVFDRRRFLELVRHFIVFEDAPTGEVEKKVAGYHQFHAVNVAVAETLRAVGKADDKIGEDTEGFFARPQHGGTKGDRRVGVVWHTQGSGKSLTMLFYAGCLVSEPAMENPTIVVLTDRNDLDDQLYNTFLRGHELLHQKPVQAEDREQLKQLLNVASGGVVFTTIQKFSPEGTANAHPVISERRNVVIIADEAHRTQYGFAAKFDKKKGTVTYGFAKYIRDAFPHASFIGFTGTPVEKGDANTRTVFGDYISIYDIHRAVEDRATVKIYYESRLAKLDLKPEEKPKIDPDFEEATEGEEATGKERLKTKWAALEKIVGADKRIRLIAADLVRHWEERREAMATQVDHGGKAMIVCMSRRICVELYNEIKRLRPEWHDEADGKGAMKIVMTGSKADPVSWQQHIRSKNRREELANRFKDPNDPFSIVIVRDMWLTGFDAPPLHTMYIDKPMSGHSLMQAIARVNRVFRKKPGGLIVDYLGIAHELKRALLAYTENSERKAEDDILDQEKAVVALLTAYDVCKAYFHGFDWSKWKTGTPVQKLALIPAAQEYVLAGARQDENPEERKQRFLVAVAELSRAFALAAPHEKALALRDEVAFFQTISAALRKGGGERKKAAEDRDAAIRQIISRAIVSDEVIDVFAAAGLKKPDISILDERFLAEVRGLPQKNVAVDLLRKLLRGEIKVRSRKFLVQSKSFAELLEQAIRKYQNRAIEAAAVIEELIKIAREMREADKRGEKLKLSDEERAFYEALADNQSAVEAMGSDELRVIAAELVTMIRNNVTIDWTVREASRAKIRVMVRRILRKHGYPPDLQDEATKTVLAQAELICADWTS